MQCGLDIFGKGIHVGALAYLQENISFEVSYGIDGALALSPFGVAGDLDARYSLGLNWHEGGGSDLFSGVSYTYVDPIGDGGAVRTDVVSAMLGAYILDDAGIEFYIRAGLSLGVKAGRVESSTWLAPNLDFGLSLNIF